MLDRLGRRYSRAFSADHSIQIKLFIWGLMMVSALCPELVWADPLTIGSIVCNARTQTSAFPTLLSAVAYVSAALLSARGLIMLRKHVDNPGSGGLVPGIAHLVVAACLFSLPWFAGVLQRTLGLSGTSNGILSDECNGLKTTGSGAAGLDVMIQNLVNDIHSPMMLLVSIISILVGLLYIFRGLHKA
ncbi:MAG: hypothetical protein AB7E52_01970, partial [Bdellovibrionales bacterium]